jgi:NADH:ubiquinone oxidoreductase subunit 3 (subunit A)
MQRPVPVSIFGILNIVFAVFALFSVFTTLNTLAEPDESKNAIVKKMHEIPAYATWVKCTVPMSLLSFALLLPAGIGLLRLGEWARKLSIAYGIYAILFVIVIVIADFVFLPQGRSGALPVSDGKNPPFVDAVIAIMGAVFGMIYPVALIVFMTRKEIAASFRPPEPRPDLPSA